MQKSQIILQDIKKVLKSILSKYLGFIDMFSKRLTMKILKHLGINKNVIKQEISK